jgi:hypothetical protein
MMEYVGGGRREKKNEIQNSITYGYFSKNSYVGSMRETSSKIQVER